MRRRLLAVAFVCVAVSVSPAAPTARALDTAEDASRRSLLMGGIGDGVAIFLGATRPESDVAFRQGHDFFYMTGVEIPDAVLVVDGMRKESVLFFTMDEKTADGMGLPVDLVRAPAKVTGIERVMPADGFNGYLAGLVRRNTPVYTLFRPEEIGPENSNEKFNALQRSMTMNGLSLIHI